MKRFFVLLISSHYFIQVDILVIGKRIYLRLYILLYGKSKEYGIAFFKLTLL